MLCCTAGVTADFALNIRKCPSFTVTTSSNASSSNDEGISDGKDSNSNSSNNIAGHVLSDIRQHHPDMFRCALPAQAGIILNNRKRLQCLSPDGAVMDRAVLFVGGV